MNGQLDCLLPTVQETGARLLLAFQFFFTAQVKSGVQLNLVS